MIWYPIRLASRPPAELKTFQAVSLSSLVSSLGRSIVSGVRMYYWAAGAQFPESRNQNQQQEGLR